METVSSLASIPGPHPGGLWVYRFRRLDLAWMEGIRVSGSAHSVPRVSDKPCYHSDFGDFEAGYLLGWNRCLGTKRRLRVTNEPDPLGGGAGNQGPPVYLVPVACAESACVDAMWGLYILELCIQSGSG